jgi:2-polyprenyl-6-hydroxyphenyl methylase/3-demethylubiquinone-9 3-methyltransferase
MSQVHAAEVKSGRRFRFGSNWRRFLRVLSEERIIVAENSLKDFLQLDSLEGKTFIDVGSGSGLFSLAARRLGASVLSFDYDPESVACTAELRRRYFPDDAQWRVIEGSVLDRDFLQSLGRFDVVYAWGVLHHTGAMWQALENVKINTKVGGQLFVAIYNDCGEFSRTWLRKKIRYNGLPTLLKLPYALAVWTPIERRSIWDHWRQGKLPEYFAQWTQYKKSRGMSRWHDMVDWLGGYPYEFTSAQQLADFFEADGFRLRRLEANTGYGNHQLVFERTG